MNEYLRNLARNEDEKRFIARSNELVIRAVQGATVLSDFLDLRQQELVKAVAVNEPLIKYHLDGGYEEAERKRLLLYPDWEETADAWIACLKIHMQEFQASSLGHRDCLGALMSLGIKREKLGDIAVQDKTAFVFADAGLADYISQQLQRVGNSSVSVNRINPDEFVFHAPEPKMIRVSLASLRLDAAIAAAYNLSRSDVNDLIAAGHVKINQLEVYKAALPVKTGDLISVRGQGRFRLEALGGMSRKNRCWVQLSVW